MSPHSPFFGIPAGAWFSDHLRPAAEATLGVGFEVQSVIGAAIEPSDEHDAHDVSGAEMAARALAAIDLAQRSPLVTVDAASAPDRCSVTLFDRAHPEFSYNITVSGTADALRCIAHLAEKTWVTKEHLEMLAVIALRRFGRGVEVKR